MQYIFAETEFSLYKKAINCIKGVLYDLKAILRSLYMRSCLTVATDFVNETWPVER